MSKQWIECAMRRAIRTVAQTALATVGASSVLSDVDWRVVASASILAGILSILTSISGLPEVDSDAPMDKEELPYDYWEKDGDCHE